MPLGIAKLPDRTPVKLTIAIDPDLHQQLRDYAAVYARAYGEEEKVETLAPVMLAGFLARDRAFQKARKTLAAPSPIAKTEEP